MADPISTGVLSAAPNLLQSYLNKPSQKNISANDVKQVRMDPGVGLPTQQQGGFSGSDFWENQLDNIYLEEVDRHVGQEGLDYWLGELDKGVHGDKDPSLWLMESISRSDEAKDLQKSLFGGPGKTQYIENTVGMDWNRLRDLMQKWFGNPWTPHGFGWGGPNSNAVRINRSQSQDQARRGALRSFQRIGQDLPTTNKRPGLSISGGTRV